MAGNKTDINNQNNKVLIIDDDEFVIHSLKDSLTKEGYELLFAVNGKEGLELLEKEEPILIILDIRMPVMDGVEFLEIAKIKPSDPYTIIALTGHGDDEDIKKCFDLGVSAFLRKPYNVLMLRGMVKNSINLKLAQLELSHEITERKNAEEALKKTHEQLIHSEKLSAIGKLSASIAHEFNNPICGIRNVLESVAGKHTADNIDNSEEKHVILAIKECDRMAELIRKLQIFYRPSSGVEELISVHESIDEIILFSITRLKSKKILLERDYGEEIPQIKGIPDQIKQVILNLVQNAEEAISAEGGKITIKTERNGSNIFVRVKDTGAGISQENIKAIFDPFFSTKPAVKETGLGLSICHGIIKRHGGDITVESQHGKGSTFTIAFPVGVEAINS